jgi:DNA repair protein RadC
MNSNVAEIKLSYSTHVKASERVSVVSSREAYDVLKQNWPTIEFIETFKAILLNRSNRALGIFEVSTGGSTRTVADPKLIFAAAIKANACGIILAHNHPSGNLNPSQADIASYQADEGRWEATGCSCAGSCYTYQGSLLQLC